MIFSVGNKKGLTWDDLRDFVKAVTDAAGEEAISPSAIDARVNFRGQLIRLSIDTQSHG